MRAPGLGSILAVPLSNSKGVPEGSLSGVALAFSSLKNGFNLDLFKLRRSLAKPDFMRRESPQVWGAKAGFSL